MNVKRRSLENFLHYLLVTWIVSIVLMHHSWLTTKCRKRLALNFKTELGLHFEQMSPSAIVRDICPELYMPHLNSLLSLLLQCCTLKYSRLIFIARLSKCPSIWQWKFDAPLEWNWLQDSNTFFSGSRCLSSRTQICFVNNVVWASSCSSFVAMQIELYSILSKLNAMDILIHQIRSPLIPDYKLKSLYFEP